MEKVGSIKMNDMNIDQACRGITCKSHSARTERADLYRICPSKLSKRELEDLYFALLENNLDLKRTINGQREKIKVLSTKVHRLTTSQKNSIGKDQICCANTKAVISEQKESIADLKNANERMSERIRLLNMRLCSAKQFLRCTPAQSTSRYISRCATAAPTTTSLKNGSFTAINTKEGDSNLKSVAVSCVENEKDVISVRSIETETNQQEKEDPNMPCDENICRTVMEELKQKIVNLQEELLQSHEEYSKRIDHLEREVSELRLVSLHARSEQALAAEGLRVRDKRAEELAAMLRGAEAHYSELALQLSLERKRVAELETRIRADSVSCQVIKTIQEHLSKMMVIKEETEEQGSASKQNVVSSSNNMEVTKESVSEYSPSGPSFYPNNTTRWDASTPRSDAPSTSRSVARTIIANDENKTSKYLDDSGFVDLNKGQEVNVEKNKVNQTLMQRINDLQTQLETLKESAVEKFNESQKKINDTVIMESDHDKEPTPGFGEFDHTSELRLKLYNESSDAVVREYDAQKIGMEQNTIQTKAEQNNNSEVEKSGDRQLKLYNSSSDTIVHAYDPNSPGNEPKKNVTAEINYLDDFKYIDDLENVSRCSTHMTMHQPDKNLKSDEINDQDNATRRKSAIMKHWQYPVMKSSINLTKQEVGEETITRIPNNKSELMNLTNNKDESELVAASPTKKNDSHNRYQIPGPIAVKENKSERKSLRQIFLEGIKRRKSMDPEISKQCDLRKRSKEKSLSFEDDEKEVLEKNIKEISNCNISVQEHRDSLVLNRIKLTNEHDEIKDPNDKNKTYSNVGEFPAMTFEKVTTVIDSSTFQEGQSQTPHGSINIVLKKEDPQLEEQSQIIPTTMQKVVEETESKEDYQIGIQTDQPEPQPEQRVRRVSLSPSRTFLYNPNENKCTRTTSPDNTEYGISSFGDPPSVMESTSPRGAPSPGEDKATSTYTASYSTPNTADYGSLSEGEMPALKGNHPTKHDSREKETDPLPANISSSQKMEAALKAITEELARCRQLLMVQTSQEQSKSDTKDVSTSVEQASERLTLRKAPARPRIGDSIAPKCVFTLHIGTVVLSDEAVMNSRDMSLVLMWKFYDQNVAMARMRTGRVILFDFSTEYDVRMTDEFINYLKSEEMSIQICEIDKQDEPFASCALPLRDALLNTNLRTDMSLALVAGPQMKRALAATDALDSGDEMGVVDLWCMLRAETKLMPAINQLLVRVPKDESTDEYRISRDLDFQRYRTNAAETDLYVVQKTGAKDDSSEPLQDTTPQNNDQGGGGRRSSLSKRRTSPSQQKSTHGIELREKGPVGFHNDSWPPAYDITTSGLLVNEIPANIKSTDEMKKALYEISQAPSSTSLKVAKRQSHKTKWFDESMVSKNDKNQDNTSSKDTRRTSKESQGLKYIKEGSEEILGKKYDGSNKSPKSVTIVPKPEKHYSIYEVPQKEKANINENDDRASFENDTFPEQEDLSGTQSLTITILWLALNEECEAMANPKVQKLYVAYNFLGHSGAELETPVSLRKPKNYVDKCNFNFSKTFQLHDSDLPLVGHMARCRSSNRLSGDPRDCIVFTVISEPPEDPLGLDSCEDIGYAQLYLGDVVAYSAGSSEYTEVVPVRAARGGVVGVLAVRLSGLYVVRRCLALSHSHRDLTLYWYLLLSTLPEHSQQSSLALPLFQAVYHS